MGTHGPPGSMSCCFKDAVAKIRSHAQRLWLGPLSNPMMICTLPAAAMRLSHCCLAALGLASQWPGTWTQAATAALAARKGTAISRRSKGGEVTITWKGRR